MERDRLAASGSRLRRGILPQADHVRLLFEHGAELDDPAGVLGGDGSRTRHVTVTSPDLDEETLVGLLDAAIELRLTPG
ncbi:MAG: hypothetical protein ACRDUY_12775 [Nitriliruptorales bacterium]